MNNDAACLGMSQLQLSSEAGLALSYTADVENRNKTPSLKSLCKLSKALHMQTYQLLMDSKELVAAGKYARIIELLSRMRSTLDEEYDRVVKDISEILHEDE